MTGVGPLAASDGEGIVHYTVAAAPQGGRAPTGQAEGWSSPPKLYVLSSFQRWRELWNLSQRSFIAKLQDFKLLSWPVAGSPRRVWSMGRRRRSSGRSSGRSAAPSGPRRAGREGLGGSRRSACAEGMNLITF